MAAKKQSATKSDYDDDDFDVTDGDDWKETEEPDDIDAPRSIAPPGVRLRDWRDVERFREERELKRLMQEDDLLFDD